MGPADRASAAARDARDAWDRGQAALASGDAAAAARWLDRASRLAPEDDTIALGLATACLSLDPRRAAELFLRVARAHDLREAWFGLAVARCRSGDAGGAAHALHEALSRHAPIPGVDVTSQAIVAAAGASGWCAVSTAGVLTLGATETAGPLTIRLLGAEPPRVEAPRRERGDLTEQKLPPRWRRAHLLEASVGDRALIGSPVDLASVRRIEGCVEWGEGGALRGWAWHPGDPEAEPLLRIEATDGTGRGLTVRPDGAGEQGASGGVLRRARAFAVSAGALARFTGPVRVLGQDGIELLGSPLDPAFVPSQTIAPRNRVRRVPKRGTPREDGCDVIIPVRDGGPLVLDCLGSVQATVGAGTGVIVVDDGSRDPSLCAELDALAGKGRIRLIRHATSLGFPRSANAGLRATSTRRDVVLLNSDTLVAPHWLERLRAAAYAAPDIGTACPLSNNATILSYPAPARPGVMPDAAGTVRLTALAHRANRGRVVEIPTAVGFCALIRRDCLREVGLLREDVFAQGYGEENDFSMRARALGWRHVAVPGVFVAHRGSLSFAGAGTDLARRNARTLRVLHPEYEQHVTSFCAADPLAEPRRRLDRLRWPRTPRQGAAVVLVTHDQGGGVERHVAERCAVLEAGGFRPIVLRPGPDRVTSVRDGLADDFPNLRFALPREAAALAAFLRRQRPERVEFHHLLDHHPGLMALPGRLGVPYTVTVHDHAWFCPRVTLLGGTGHYCGEPDVRACEACVAAHGSALEEDITVADLRTRSSAFLRAAMRVTAPSRDAARRMARHFPGLPIAVEPHERLAPVCRAAPRAEGELVRVCVVGGISAAKGYGVLLDAARDAAARKLLLHFTVVGSTDDDSRLIETGRAFVTGPYAPGGATALIRAQRAHLALLPTVVPETWCYALGEAWRAGLDVMAFDIGAQAERIRRAGSGWLVPLGLSARGLNDTILAVARKTGHEWPGHSQPKIAVGRTPLRAQP